MEVEAEETLKFNKLNFQTKPVWGGAKPGDSRASGHILPIAHLIFGVCRKQLRVAVANAHDE